MYLRGKCSDSHHYTVSVAGQATILTSESVKGEKKKKKSSKGEERYYNGLSKEKDNSVHAQVMKLAKETSRVSVLPTASKGRRSVQLRGLLDCVPNERL